MPPATSAAGVRIIASGRKAKSAMMKVRSSTRIYITADASAIPADSVRRLLSAPRNRWASDAVTAVEL